MESSEKESENESDEPETGSENEKEVESERETDDEKEKKNDEIVQIEPIKSRIIVGGRDILNLGLNLAGKSFVFNYAQLPENDNIHFFLDNRSQYHRLGATGHIQEYTMEQCKCCEFQYPVNGFQTNGGGTSGQATNGLASNLLSFNINQIIGANNASNNNAKCNPINRGIKPFSANNMSQMNKNYRMNNGPNSFAGSMPQRNNFNLTGQNYGNKFNNNMNGAQQNRVGTFNTELGRSDMASNGNSGNIYYNNQAAPYYNYNANDKSTQMRSYGNNTSAAYNNSNSYNNYNNKNFFNYYNKNM